MNHFEFEQTKLCELYQAVGATSAVCLLIYHGYLTIEEASECFGESEAVWDELYEAWLEKFEDTED